MTHLVEDPPPLEGVAVALPAPDAEGSTTAAAVLLINA